MGSVGTPILEDLDPYPPTGTRTPATPSTTKSLYTPPRARACPTLTDKGCTGAGIGILIPAKARSLDADTLSGNKIIGILRAPPNAPTRF